MATLNIIFAIVIIGYLRGTIRNERANEQAEVWLQEQLRDAYAQGWNDCAGIANDFINNPRIVRH